jgi:saccharopine dehydrogenase-like NADP-dependent oxidoreductase
MTGRHCRGSATNSPAATFSPCAHRPGRLKGSLSMRVAIVGCGLIGHKRAQALADAKFVATADVSLDRAKKLAATQPGCNASDDWRSVVARPDVDVVFVATTNDAIASVTRAAVEQGKHVLVEKPAARNPWELEPVLEARGVRGCGESGLQPSLSSGIPQGARAV